jgi:hypothetical protein
MFTTLLVVVGALFMAVFASTILDPSQSTATPGSDDDALRMDTIALSGF